MGVQLHHLKVDALLEKVGVALELMPTSAACSTVTLSSAWPSSWARGVSGQERSRLG